MQLASLKCADFVAKVGCGGWMPSTVRLRATGFDLPALTLYATITLRDALNRIWRRPGDERCKPPQVLSDGGQNKLILRAWATQS